MALKYASAVLAVLAAGCTGEAADDSPPRGIEGAWELVSYELEGRDVAVSGILVFSGGKFGMIYSMGPGKQADSGRAHIGAYEVRDGEVKFDVDLWVQKTEQSTGLVPGTSVGAEMEWQDELLVLRFEGGSVQGLRPVGVEDGTLASGSWKLEDGKSQDGNPLRGALVASENRYVLLYVDDTARKGQAYGGTVNEDGDVRADWAISVDGESGAVLPGEVPLRFSKGDHSVQIRDDKGDLLTFTAE